MRAAWSCVTACSPCPDPGLFSLRLFFFRRVAGIEDAVCCPDDPLCHGVRELGVFEPVLEVSARVFGTVEVEYFAAEECDAFCFDLANRSPGVGVAWVVKEDLRDFVEEVSCGSAAFEKLYLDPNNPRLGCLRMIKSVL